MTYLNKKKMMMSIIMLLVGLIFIFYGIIGSYSNYHTQNKAPVTTEHEIENTAPMEIA